MQGTALEAYQAEISSGLVSFEEVKAMPPKFLWEPYLRLNNLNIVRGDGGAGKTMFVLAVLAAITRGKAPDGMPGILRCQASDVLYLGAEDDPEDYRYRLDLCGCDARRVLTPRSLPNIGSLEAMERLIREANAKAVVLDPIQAFLPPGADMNRANEMRPLLDGLRALCRKTECTAILIEHLNKGTKQKAAYRGIGSVDFVNAARSVLMVGYHPHEPGARVCMQIKSNAKYGQTIRFAIDDMGRFQWQGVCDVKEDDVLEARRVAVHKNTDPVLLLVRYLLERGNGEWCGTATRMIAEGAALGLGLTDSRTVGRRLPGLAETLQKEGILWTQRRTSGGTLHSFRRTSGALPSTSTNDE